eukprot:5945927-Ditylum_brightwellii.AAC.1
MVGGDAVEEGKFSHEEQMRRERARLMATGVTSFQLSKPQSDGAIVGLIPHGGGLWIWDTTNTQPRLLVESSDKGLRDGTTLLDAKISSDGSTVAFVADDEVYVMSVDEEGGPTQVTSGARDVEGRTNGVSDYLAQEELSRPE